MTSQADSKLPTDAGFEFLAENIGDIVTRAAPDCTIRYVSGAVRRYGWEPAELIGKTPDQMLHPDDVERFRANTEALFRGEVTPDQDRQHRYRAASGEWVWLEGSPRLIRDADGKPVEIINVFRDVTHRRALRDQADEQARWAALAEQVAAIGYWRLDARTQEITWSPHMYRIFGLEPGAAPDLERAMAMVHPEDQERSNANLARSLKSGEPWNAARVRVMAADGQVREIDGNGICEFDEQGAVVAVFGTLVDVTERRQNERLFEAAFEQAAIGKSLVSPSGRFMRVNATLCDLLGYSEAELTELHVWEITHSEDRQTTHDALRRFLEGEVAVHRVDKRYVRKDGSTVWVDLSVAPVRNADGRLCCFVAQAHDLTARRSAEAALRESEARYRLIAENMSDVIAVSNLDATVRYVSPSVRRGGRQSEDILGRTFGNSIHPDDLPKVQATWADLTAGGQPQRLRWRGRWREPEGWRWMESSPTLLRDPETQEPTGVLDVIRDVDAQVAQEEALAKAKRDAEAAAEAKAQFLANMSHEIRTPLTSVLGFTGVLAARRDLDPEVRRCVERIEGASRGLLSIVNDILDVSRLEAGRFEIRPSVVDIRALARESLDVIAAQAEAKELVVSLELDGAIPARVTLDGERLRQILINLLGNAAKFTAEGSIRLRVGYDSATERLSVEVVDTGPGLRPAERARLFQRFSQADSSATRRHGGAGLGLAICKGLAEAMGGRIGVRSRRGAGSTFFLDLPATAGAPVQAEDTAAPDGPVLGGLSVLVVDDNPWNRELARPLLEALGAQVSEAESGAAALECCAVSAFDLILLDLHMPGLGGEQTLRRLRASKGANRGTPVLAFTADAGRGAIPGFQGLVRKPIETHQLFAQIAGALSEPAAEASAAG